MAVGLYLAAPKTLLTLYCFAAVLGVTWLATVPATAGVVGKLFGLRHLSTLFGLTIVTHQAGAFFGAWLGGVVMARTGSYHWVWIIDMGFAASAAVVTLPIREPLVRGVRPPRPTRPDGQRPSAGFRHIAAGARAAPAESVNVKRPSSCGRARQPRYSGAVSAPVTTRAPPAQQKAIGGNMSTRALTGGRGARRWR